MISFVKKIFKRLSCKHENVNLEYKGMCVDRYRCTECGKDFIEKKGKSL